MILRSLMHALLLIAGGPWLARDEDEVFRRFRRALERAASLTRGRDIAAG